jgi:hypothetical protein
MSPVEVGNWVGIPALVGACRHRHPVVIIFVDWVHAVHLVSLSLVILLLIGGELFPGVTDQSSDGPTLRRNTGFGLLQAEDIEQRRTYCNQSCYAYDLPVYLVAGILPFALH